MHGEKNACIVASLHGVQFCLCTKAPGRYCEHRVGTERGGLDDCIHRDGDRCDETNARRHAATFVLVPADGSADGQKLKQISALLSELQTLGALIAHATNAYREFWDERAGDEMQRQRDEANDVKMRILEIFRCKGGER